MSFELDMKIYVKMKFDVVKQDFGKRKVVLLLGK